MSDLSEPSRPTHGADNRAWPTLSQAFVVWLRVALLSFGGPAGQMAVMHRILVEEKRWLGEERFLHALNFCMLLPGPEAQQLAVYIGWMMHRTVGGLIAGILFVLPGVLAIMALSWIYASYGEVGLVTWIFFGLKAAVLAIVLNAVVRIGKRALRNNVMKAIAVVSFVAIFLFGAPFPLIIGSAALIGYLAGRAGLIPLNVSGGHGPRNAAQVADAQTLLGEQVPVHAIAGNRHWLRTAGILLTLWLGPTGVLFALLGPDHVFTDIAVFFSKMAVVTFGGAYAVLAYVAQAAVDTHGWLKPGEMLDGLGMAETTPGPLIMVTQFVGFIGAYRDPGELSPLMAGTLGGLLTTWVTFVPCFLWIFLGAPHVERLRGNASLSAALAAITAAVVGVILNLGLWFGLHVLFADIGIVESYGLHLLVPNLATIDMSALMLSAITLVAAFRYQVGTALLLLGAAAMGVMLGFLGLGG